MNLSPIYSLSRVVFPKKVEQRHILCKDDRWLRPFGVADYTEPNTILGCLTEVLLDPMVLQIELVCLGLHGYHITLAFQGVGDFFEHRMNQCILRD